MRMRESLWQGLYVSAYTILAAKSMYRDFSDYMSNSCDQMSCFSLCKWVDEYITKHQYFDRNIIKSDDDYYHLIRVFLHQLLDDDKFHLELKDKKVDAISYEKETSDLKKYLRFSTRLLTISKKRSSPFFIDLKNSIKSIRYDDQSVAEKLPF